MKKRIRIIDISHLHPAKANLGIGILPERVAHRAAVSSQLSALRFAMLSVEAGRTVQGSGHREQREARQSAAPET